MKLISLSQIEKNIKSLSLSHELNLCIKDDAYHIGLERILGIVKKYPITYFSTNSIEEALKVIEILPYAKVLILGNEKREGLSHNIFLTCESVEDFIWLKKRQIPFYFKWNVGMNRFGIQLDDWIISTDLCKGIYLHNPYQKKNQINQLFEQVKKELSLRNLKAKKVVVGGSSLLPYDLPYQYRIGIAIYQNALEYRANLIRIRKIQKGETVGYEGLFKAKKECIIGVLDFGYKNGFKRNNKNSFVSINQKKYPLIGYKCMDYSFVLLDSLVKQSDKVYVIGENISIKDFLKSEGITYYEALIKLS